MLTVLDYSMALVNASTEEQLYRHRLINRINTDRPFYIDEDGYIITYYGFYTSGHESVYGWVLNGQRFNADFIRRIAIDISKAITELVIDCQTIQTRDENTGRIVKAADCPHLRAIIKSEVFCTIDYIRRTRRPVPLYYEETVISHLAFDCRIQRPLLDITTTLQHESNLPETDGIAIRERNHRQIRRRQTTTQRLP